MADYGIGVNIKGYFLDGQHVYEQEEFLAVAAALRNAVPKPQEVLLDSKWRRPFVSVGPVDIGGYAAHQARRILSDSNYNSESDRFSKCIEGNTESYCSTRHIGDQLLYKVNKYIADAERKLTVGGELKCPPPKIY